MRKHLAGLLELSHRSSSQRAVRRGPVPQLPGLTQPLGSSRPLCFLAMAPPHVMTLWDPLISTLYFVNKHTPPSGADPQRPRGPGAHGNSCPQGIALAIGIAATSHLEVVWAVLEHLGRDRFLGSQDSQVDGVSGDTEGLVAWRHLPALSLGLLTGNKR